MIKSLILRDIIMNDNIITRIEKLEPKKEVKL